jgi:hypothetical protein
MARRTVDWGGAFGRQLDSQYAVTVATCQARLLSEAGQGKEASELALDLAQYGLDVGRTGDLLDLMIGVSVLGFSLEELRRQLVSAPMAHEHLLEISRELGVLDGNFPRPG